MIGIADVMAWLKSLDAFGGDPDVKWTMARLDAGAQKRVGVYQRPDYGGAEVALGGAACTLTRRKRVQVLVHWTKNAKATEEAAQALYDAASAAQGASIGDATAVYVAPGMPEPADLGADDNGIFERVIWLDIHYQDN